MNPALATDALYAKSQVYIQRGFRAQAAGDFEEYQLWASLAMELLGKAALAGVHPSLIADPQHYQSLFAACGRQISPDVRTHHGENSLFAPSLESIMATVNGGLTRQSRLVGRLPDEERVLLACIEDILQAAPGLHYTRDVEPPSVARNGRPFATLTIETNPHCRLTCSLELSARSMVIVVNGRRFERKRGASIPFEWWVERRCRDVMALADGDLRIETSATLAQVSSCRLSAGRGDKWRVLATYDNGWVGVLGYLLPFGLMMLSRERTEIYSDWFNVS